MGYRKPTANPSYAPRRLLPLAAQLQLQHRVFKLTDIPLITAAHRKVVLEGVVRRQLSKIAPSPYPLAPYLGIAETRGGVALHAALVLVANLHHVARPRVIVVQVAESAALVGANILWRPLNLEPSFNNALVQLVVLLGSGG